MALYTVINPAETPISAPYGTFPGWSVTTPVDLTDSQARNIVRQRGAALLDDNASDKTLGRVAFLLLGEATGGYKTPQERELIRLRQSQQDWQNVITVLRSID